jgi:TPR repeat protein
LSEESLAERAAELRDEALFKDPPPMEDCPICFLPMPLRLISCSSLPPATITSVPIKDFAEANEELAKVETERYYECCGKSICGGCIYSCIKSGNIGKCPFCNFDRADKTDEEAIEQLTKRMEVNDASSIYLLGRFYHHGKHGLLQDHTKAIELYTRAAELGSSHAHFRLGNVYREGGKLKKAKFHYEAAAMAGHNGARHNLGTMEYESGNMDQAVKHWMIAASAGDYTAMNSLQIEFKQGLVSRDAIDSTLTAYNNSCVMMRSEARDAYIHEFMHSLNL